MAAVPPVTGSGYLSGGDAPGSVPLTIGSVQFNSIEAPEKLPLGAVEQKMAVIELLGGGRVTQALGVQPKQVRWSGKFWGSNVAPRVQQLRGYCVSGLAYPVYWGNESWSAVVREFTPTYNQSWICEYEIMLEIVDGAALASTSFPSSDSQIDGINSQIQAVVGQIDQQENLIGWGNVSAAWALYLIALGLLYQSEQIYQTGGTTSPF